MLRTQSDARLVDLVRAGHASAFEAIVQRYRKQLLAYCSRLLPASRAEDAVQQTFLKAYQSMISGDAELNLRPWLYRIAHNASLNLLRQNGWSHEELNENMDGVQRPDQAFELRERLRSTVKAVKDLPERQRNAVLLREIDGLSYEQIALALGVGDGAVRQLLHRARATLRAGMTAVTPVGVVDRLAAALAASGGDPTARVAEAAAGIGLTAGAAKFGAAVLATGVIATGAATVPLHHHRHSATRTTADKAAVDPPATTSAAPATAVVEHSGSNTGSDHHGSSHRSGRHSSGHEQKSGSGDHHGSSGRSGEDGSRRQHSGSGGEGERHSGSGGSEKKQSGSGGSNDGTEHHNGSGDQSGSGAGHDGGEGGVQLPETEDHHKSGGGGDDGPTLTAPTTTVTAPMPSGDSGKSGDSGSGSGSGSGD
jgi:RNA polymerase sigma factor (sigma-70 family)